MTGVRDRRAWREITVGGRGGRSKDSLKDNFDSHGAYVLVMSRDERVRKSGAQLRELHLEPLQVAVRNMRFSARRCAMVPHCFWCPPVFQSGRTDESEKEVSRELLGVDSQSAPFVWQSCGRRSVKGERIPARGEEEEDELHCSIGSCKPHSWLRL